MNRNEKLNKILDEKEDLVDAKDDDNSLTENNQKTFENISQKNYEVLKFLNKDELFLLIDKLNKDDKLTKIIEDDIKQETLDSLKKYEDEQYDTIQLDKKDEENIEKDEEYEEEEENDYIKLCKYIPLRLTYDERLYLRLLESTLEVSEYTDKIDIYHSGNKSRKIVREIKTLCSILSGLIIANNYENGQKLIRDRDFLKNSSFFSFVFEIGRRYKILNPDRMRSSYGKLMYFLMDTRREDIYELLSFDCVSPIKTVYDLLKDKKNGFQLLKDDLIKKATMEINAKGSRNEIQKQIKQKEEAIKYLSRKYSNNNNKNIFRINIPIFNNQNLDENNTNEQQELKYLSSEEIERCLYSLCDYNTHIKMFCEPCEIMIEYLKTYYDPHNKDPCYSLSIEAGRHGSRLTHSHNRQYMYVLQTLHLWKEIGEHMFSLWACAENDMLDFKNPYRLMDTGQGLNRMQSGHKVLSAMKKILHNVQKKLGGWVGSSMIHMGDTNIPNTFMFIDKYTQVPRILNPIVLCLRKIDELYNSTLSMKNYINNEFKGAHNLKMMITCDFFRHAFDGSGGDNFNEAGSCIDGRLTSAWNWCSKIEKKVYFPIFLLTGFIGFDGSF
ncbi:conserved protein, unknown function [Plasmodium berghei]|uniref:Non-canonical E2 ubiquitin-conjugating enzyme C-terminal domain-containing protein n=2 Tax=Plasmodium berghei TaxID=5821 RepID=A0A509AUX4_PLABA|nr:conserved protein, unknown function [Plasmodium berghei ANKA]CXJ17851.1 conserved protein, unknown function [Plasmodium berghei]SCM26400.1 conserved protein, unknown function [Plasmodium berghei]SCN28436.1 conserved protein, unknown function [Plasmodium berghei]SCO62629.1 conserved protein, unknown function [Plasmodium berghei]SCO64188.1 conserved protein, unknown function [Plasmodium berghei]|eukprot:XP_034424084.1 conserved protein, unknown function [Plasmodium berghei ANKA]